MVKIKAPLRAWALGSTAGCYPAHACFQELARRFVAEEVTPVAAAYDASMEYPQPIFEKAHALGLANPHIPVSCGGLGLSTLDGVVIAEEFAYGCTGISTDLCTILIQVLRFEQSPHQSLVSPPV